MLWLAILFVAVPALELALLIEIGTRIGTLPTFALILGTGILGASLARAQGLGVLQRIQRDLAEGRPPATALVDGAIVLFSAALLLTPGILTDMVGFAGLVPPIRALMRTLAWRFVERAIERRQLRVHTFGPAGEAGFGAGRATVETDDYVVVSRDDGAMGEPSGLRHSERAHSGRADLEPAHSEPADSEPANSETAHSEPVDSETAHSDPADSEPGDSEPGDSEQAGPEPAGPQRRG